MFISITVFKINKFIIKEIYLESYRRYCKSVCAVLPKYSRKKKCSKIQYLYLLE